jgi:TRAP-type C4-dicarboxylate transport system substrate-binding protein
MKKNRALGLFGGISLVLALLIFPFTVAFSATTQTPTFTLKISHGQAGNPADNDKHGAATRFKDIVEKQTNGAVKVEIYPLGQLYADKDSVVAVADGTIFGAILGADVLPPWEKSTYIFQFPGLFMDKDTMHRFLGSEKGGKEVEKRLMESGLFPAWWLSGAHQFFTAKKQITSLADAKGLKIRCNESEILNKTIQALGASGINMSSSEMYTAAQTGMIDGALTLESSVTGRKLQEVFHFSLNDPVWTSSNLGVSIASVKTLNKLPSDIRKIVQDAWLLSAKQHEEIDQAKLIVSAHNVLVASGMKFTSLDQKSRATVVKTWQDQAGTYGAKYGITPLYNEAMRLQK